jgi:polar amino acid transport system ATP-binding protein
MEHGGGAGESQHYGSQGLHPTGPGTKHEPSAHPSPEELGPLSPGEPRRPIAHTELGAEMLRIEGVRKSFGELEVLKGIDLSVAEHEVVALIGASGSGKSTLLRCINLIEPIDEGRIVVGGKEITDPRVSVDKVRRGIGIVYQSYNLFPHMTVLANVTLAPRKVLKLSRAEAESRATELLTRFGLAAKKDVHPDRLSGGQQQRVAIVRALAMRPDLLLLDEITSALDPVLVSEVLDVVRELAVQGMTMVIATHEMGFARDVANRVCFLHQGTILEQGPATEILGNPARPETQAFLERVIRAGRL